MTWGVKECHHNNKMIVISTKFSNLILVNLIKLNFHPWDQIWRGTNISLRIRRAIQKILNFAEQNFHFSEILRIFFSKRCRYTSRVYKMAKAFMFLWLFFVYPICVKPIFEDRLPSCGKLDKIDGMVIHIDRLNLSSGDSGHCHPHRDRPLWELPCPLMKIGWGVCCNFFYCMEKAKWNFFGVIEV